MTELNRVASHLVWVATQGMDVGALSMMLYGFRERELILDVLREDHRPADEPQLHPSRRRRRRPARRLGGRRRATSSRSIPVGLADYETCSTENPIFVERTQGVGVITPDECMAFGVTGANATGVRGGAGTSARRSPTRGSSSTSSRCPTGKHGDVYDRYLVRMEEMRQSLGSSGRSPSRCRPATTAPTTAR